MKKNFRENALVWEPQSNDEYGDEKKLFLHFMARNCLGRKNARAIKTIISLAHFKHNFSKEHFQHAVIVPLREDPTVFIGTSQKGIFLISDADDAFTTINFYTNRIRSEHKHLRNLRTIIKRTRLFDHYTSAVRKRNNTHIYLDESGVPDLSNKKIDPYFIVTAVIIESKKPEKDVFKKLDLIKYVLHRKEDDELKSTSLNKKEYLYVVKELSTIDYEFASICFVKDKLEGQDFNYPKSFYKYAYQFLLDDVLNYVGSAKLYFDNYGGNQFKDEFFAYLRKQNAGFPIDKIEQLEMFDSKKNPCLRFADIIGGVVKNYAKGKGNLLPLIDEKKIDVCFFPYLK